jgi:Rieske 2Fe-2S family protein
MRLKAGVTTMSLDGQSRSVPMPGLEGDALRQVSYYGVFPNLLVSLHPDYVMTHHVEPLGPEETRVTCTWLFPPEAKARPDFDPAYAADFWDRTNRQDWRACEAVARGLRSPGFRQGPLTWKEDGVHAFMAMMANAYRDGVVSRPGAILERPRQG